MTSHSSSKDSQETNKSSNNGPTNLFPWKHDEITQPVGSLLRTHTKDKKPVPELFTPYQLGSLKLKNRVIVSPMCMYSSDNGFLNDYHLVHLGKFAMGGCAMVIQEATAVAPNGRISPYDAGLWCEDHIKQEQRIVNFLHSQNSYAGIQIAHAGRKASTPSPYLYNRNKNFVDEKEDGWPSEVYGPSPLPFDEGWIKPKEMSVKEIKEVVELFVKSSKLALKAGFDLVEIHGAHGYLLSSFLSSTSNQRKDSYGGSFENRTRFLLEIVKGVRAVWPKQKPVAVRLSCDEWFEGKGWNIDDTIKLVQLLIDLGVDMIDCSSGGNNPKQKIAVRPGYQLPFAEKIKSTYGNKVAVGAVGLLTAPQQCNDIIKNKQADLVLLARQLLRDPNFVLNAATTLSADISFPPQYQRWLGRL